MNSFPGTGESVTPGAQLSAARIAAGLSVADVAAQMRITPRQVEALEGDRFEELPGPVFVRGFIRNYARVLKLEPVPLLHALEPMLAYDAPLKAQATAGRMPVATRRGRSNLLLACLASLFILVVIAGAYELWSRQRGAFLKAQPPVPAVAAPIAKEVKPQASPSTASQDAPQPSAKAAPDTAAPSADAASAGAPAESVPAVPSPAPAQPPTGGRIDVRFVRDAWVEIRDAEGRVLITGTGAAQSERHLEGKAPFSVVIGNVGGVTMTYNGKPVDFSAYAARNIARFTLE
jgi:cytoskeleton protein RodZ